MTVGEFKGYCLFPDDTKCVVYDAAEDKELFEGNVDGIPDELQKRAFECFAVNNEGLVTIHVDTKK